MPKRAAPDPDSSPESSAMADSPPWSGGGEKSPVEERDVDEEEEEVEEEEDDEGEREEGSEGEEAVEVEEEEGGDSSDAEDANEHMESEDNGIYLKLGCSAHERSGIDRTLTLHGQNGVSDLSASDPPAKLLAVDSKEASAINNRGTRPVIQDKHIVSSKENRFPWQDKHIMSPKENRFPKSHLAGRDIEVLLEKESSIEASKDVRRYNIEGLGSPKFNLSFGSLVGVEDTRLLHINKDKLAVQSMIKSGSRCGNMDGVVEKDAPNPYTKVNVQPPEDFGMSSMRIPQRRPGSSCPGALVEILNTRPAMVCEFFKKGWCIKGNSCSFLHLKEVDTSSNQWAKENLVEPSMKHGFVDHTGSREEAQSLKLSTSHEPLDSLNFEKSSKSDFNRALVWAYGGDGCGSTHFHDEYTKHSSKTAAEEQFRSDIIGNRRALNLPLNELQLASLVPERYQRPAGVSPYIDSMDDRHSTSGEVLSRRYLDERKVHQQMPRREFLNDATFSGQSSVATGLYQNSNNPYSHGKLAEDVAIHYQQSRFPLPDLKYGSYSLCSSLSSSFDNSVQPYDGSPSVHTLAQIGASSTNGYTPLSAMYLDGHRPFHFDRGYYGLDNSLQPSDSSPAVQTLAQTGPSSIHGSTPLGANHLDSHRPFNFDRGYYSPGSALLPRKASPYFSGPEMESSMQQGPLGDIPPAGLKIQENSWEPSEHFRSSFCAPAGKSSSGSQYDPPLDSVAPHKAENLKSSPITFIHNFSSQYINDDPILSGHAAEYSSQKSLSSLHHSTESISDKKTSAHQFCGYITPVAASGPDTVVGENDSTSRDEKHWVPHATDGKNVSGADLCGNTRNQADKATNGKDPKAFRIFRAALVDFVKELLKPFWREGHLSKDAHKMIVKKAVEKVITSLQPHQIPSTTESINQYLSLSQTKLLKLVEGYVDKYAKS